MVQAVRDLTDATLQVVSMDAWYFAAVAMPQRRRRHAVTSRTSPRDEDT